MTEEEMNDKLNQFFGDDTPEENDTDSQTAVKAIEKHQSAVADIACLISDGIPEKFQKEYRLRYNADLDNEMALAILTRDKNAIDAVVDRVNSVESIDKMVGLYLVLQWMEIDLAFAFHLGLKEALVELEELKQEIIRFKKDHPEA